MGEEPSPPVIGWGSSLLRLLRLRKSSILIYPLGRALTLYLLVSEYPSWYGILFPIIELLINIAL